MEKGLMLFAEKIKALRVQTNITQADLARELGITRASVNGWEMGLSVPSTPLLVELAVFFAVSVDYLLGLEQNAVLKIDKLSPKEVAVLVELVNCLRNKER